MSQNPNEGISTVVVETLLNATEKTVETQKTLENSFLITGEIVEATKSETKKMDPLDPEMYQFYKEPILVGHEQKVLLRRLFASHGITFETLREIAVKRERPLSELDFAELINCDCVIDEFWRENNKIALPKLECVICHGAVYPNEIAIVKDGEIVGGPQMDTPGTGIFVVKMAKIRGRNEVRILVGCGLIDCETSHAFKLRAKRFLKNGTVDKSEELFPTFTYMEALKFARKLAKKFRAKFDDPQERLQQHDNVKPETSPKKEVSETAVEIIPTLTISPEKDEQKKRWENKHKKKK